MKRTVTCFSLLDIKAEKKKARSFFSFSFGGGMVGGGEEENLLCEGLQRKNMSTSRVRRRRKWKNDENMTFS